MNGNTYTGDVNTCPCCNGAKVQINKLTGIVILCPCCGGTGIRISEVIVTW